MWRGLNCCNKSFGCGQPELCRHHFSTPIYTRTPELERIEILHRILYLPFTSLSRRATLINPFTNIWNHSSELQIRSHILILLLECISFCRVSCVVLSFLPCVSKLGRGSFPLGNQDQALGNWSPINFTVPKICWNRVTKVVTQKRSSQGKFRHKLS